MKALFVLISLAVAAPAATITVSDIYPVSTPIPDNRSIGVANTQSIETVITSVSGIEVGLTLRGGWNGDLYAYLRYGDGFSVLLNRPGRSSGQPDGSGSSGMDVVFSDTAASDIHLTIPDSGMVGGDYQPDARNVDPANALDSDPRTAFLATFKGVDPNGEWTIFVADVAPGGTSVLESWSLTITGVPEPSSSLLLAAGSVLLFRRRRLL